jgi:hypothetical protein
MNSTISAENANSNNSALKESMAYNLNYSVSSSKKEATPDMTDFEKKMVLKCKSCGSDFDSTFSVYEFSLLSEDQNRSGTLHLCPHCGNLSIYELSDYREPK